MRGRQTERKKESEREKEERVFLIRGKTRRKIFKREMQKRV